MPDHPLTYTLRQGSHDGIQILSLSGPLTLGNILTFQKDLQNIRPPFLIVDLANVPYIDSAGLGLLVSFYVSAQNNGRRVAVAGTTQRVLTLFEMTKVDSLLGMFPTVEQAEAAG